MSIDVSNAEIRVANPAAELPDEAFDALASLLIDYVIASDEQAEFAIREDKRRYKKTPRNSE